MVIAMSTKYREWWGVLEANYVTLWLKPVRNRQFSGTMSKAKWLWSFQVRWYPKNPRTDLASCSIRDLIRFLVYPVMSQGMPTTWMWEPIRFGGGSWLPELAGLNAAIGRSCGFREFPPVDWFSYPLADWLRRGPPWLSQCWTVHHIMRRAHALG